MAKTKAEFKISCLNCHNFQVITLCERLAGQDANVTTVPVSILRVTRQLTRLFEWTNDVADRLAFSEVNNINQNFTLKKKKRKRFSLS